ncbi:MAG TPA: hypothetical protein VHX37_13540 [Acidobacteriaceae bacterium]|jgi:hypothetical protein|nr:hypothetical protein [Acidobacteriaceae bacterium]
MATAIQLELTVDEKGAVQGIRAFDTSVKGAAGTVHQLNDELNKTSGHADGLKKLANEFTSNEGSIRTMNAEVRSLQGSIFGDTRAASEFLATLPKIGEAMELAFPVFGATALIGVLVMGAEKIHEFYEKWIDVDSAVRKYQQDAMKAAQTELFDRGSMEAQIAMVGDLNAQVDELYRKRKTSESWLTHIGNEIGGSGGPAWATGGDRKFFNAEDAERLGKLQMQQGEQRIHQMDEEHKAQAAALQNEERLAAARVPDYRRDAVKQEYAVRQAAMEREYSARRDTALAGTYNAGVDAYNYGKNAQDQMEHVQVPKNDGMLQEKQAVDAADAQYRADEIERARSNSIEIRHLQEQAEQASLRGIPLFQAQEGAAIEELRDRGIASATAVGAVKAKFHAEEMKRYQEEQTAVARRESEASGAGLTGVAKVRFEGQQRDKDILDNAAAGKYQSLNDAQRDRVSNWEATNAQILAEEQTFTQKLNQLVDEQTGHQLSGFAKIRSEVQRQQDAWRADYEKEYGKPGSAGYQSHTGQLNQGLGAIAAGGAGQTADLGRRNEEETEQIETQARAKLLSAEKQQTAAIEDEYNQRLAKYRDELNQQLISQDDYNRRVVAAGEEMQAELIDQARQAREKIAGELKGLIGAHPLQALEEAGSKFASQAGASLIQRAATHYGVQTGGSRSGSIFDRIAGVSHIPRNPDEHAEMPGARVGGAAGVMTLRTATIYVSSANIVGAGGGGGSRGGAMGSSWSPSGSAGGSSFGAGFSGTSGAGGGYGGGFSDAWSGSGGGPITSAPSAAPAPSAAGGVSGAMSDVGHGFTAARSISSTFSQRGSSTGGGDVSFGGGPITSAPSTSGGVSGGLSDAWAGAGGSGDGGGAGASAAAARTPAPAPSTAGGVGGALHNVGAGLSTARSIGSMITAGRSGAAASDLEPQEVTLTNQIGGGNAPAAAAPSAYSQSMLGGGMTVSNTLGAAGAGIGLFSASKQGGFGGMLGGAMSGAELGMDVGGPIGAGIGAIAGAAIGFFGGGEQARVWWLQNGRPRLATDMDTYEQSGDYTSAYTDMESLKYSAMETLKKMGFTGEKYYHDTVTGEISQAEAKLNREQKAGRSADTFSTAMYNTGIDSVPAMLTPGERVMPTDQNERITRAVESYPALHSAYRDAVQSSPGRGATQGGGNTYQLHVHAIDTKSATDFLMDNADTIRAAHNSAYGIYGGEAGG